MDQLERGEEVRDQENRDETTLWSLGDSNSDILLAKQALYQLS